MKRTLFAAIGFAITCVGVALNAPASANMTPSSYQNSCRDMYFDREANVLEANCFNGDRFVYTNIPLVGIENIDGNLKPTYNNRLSNFNETCGRFSVSGNVLRATCRTRNGGLRKTAIALNGIQNYNGDLRYYSDDYASNEYIPTNYTPIPQMY